MSPSNAPVWRRGIVKQLDPAKARVKVLLPDEDQVLTDWLPVLMPFALGARAYWLPRQGSQVVVLLDEHGEDGVVMGALYSQTDPAPISAAKTLYIEAEDGTKVFVDPVAHQVTVDTPGQILLKATGNVAVQSQADVDVTATGHVNTSSATATVHATTSITLDAPLVNATQVLKVDGVIQANGGLTTTSGGAIPGNLNMAGGGQFGAQVQAPDATLGGKSFLGHQHQAQGATAITTVPV